MEQEQERRKEQERVIWGELYRQKLFGVVLTGLITALVIIFFVGSRQLIDSPNLFEVIGGAACVMGAVLLFFAAILPFSTDSALERIKKELEP